MQICASIRGDSAHVLICVYSSYTLHTIIVQQTYTWKWGLAWRCQQKPQNKSENTENIAVSLENKIQELVARCLPSEFEYQLSNSYTKQTRY